MGEPQLQMVDSHELLKQNMANYGPYSCIAQNYEMSINTWDIDDTNIDEQIDCIFNIFSDGIDTDEIQSAMVHVTFPDKKDRVINYVLEDYLLQLIFWKLPVSIGEPLTTETIFWSRGITTGYIGNYVNNIFIKKFINRIKRDNIQMNLELLLNMNVNINETFEVFKKFIRYQQYMNMTLCLEDTLDFMNEYPEFNDAMHVRLADAPIADVYKLGMDATNVQIKYITRPDSHHCLKMYFISGECLSTKQYKETSAHIGFKPNGEGGLIPAPIDGSFLTGALSTPEAYTVDASASRVAQMLSHENVGRSGDFARILELNSMDTKLYPDSRYKCDTKHTITRYIKDQATLNIYDGRYYRFRKIYEDGRMEADHIIDAQKDKWLIGRTIELYSPMTCASRSRGEGVCYRCYGDLAYTNFNINIGVIATELVSSKYTQVQLSAKHLLEAHVRELTWNNPVEDILRINANTITCYDDEEHLERYANSKLIINTADFDYEDENDDLEYNAFITSFCIVENGVTTEYHTGNGECIYLSNEMDDIIASRLKSIRTRNGYQDDEDVDVDIPMAELVDLDQLFLFHIGNDELSRFVTAAKRLLNKGSETGSLSKDEILDQFCAINLSGGFGTSSIHYEIILANQMRDADDELEYPDWTEVNTRYQILTLDKSLRHNPSVTTSLQYQKIAQQIWKPITYIKHKPSMNDLYFMVQPQKYIHVDGLVTDKVDIKSDADENMKECVTFNKDLIGKMGK